MWASAIYLASKDKFHWIASLPATFMTAVVTTFIMQEKIGLSLDPVLSRRVGIVLAFAAFLAFKKRHQTRFQDSGLRI